MTREEEIIQAADECYPTWEEHNAGFYQGAKWADEHPKEGLVDIEKIIEKAIEKLDYVFDKYEEIMDRDVREDFRKAMEE